MTIKWVLGCALALAVPAGAAAADAKTQAKTKKPVVKTAKAPARPAVRTPLKHSAKAPAKGVAKVPAKGPTRGVTNALSRRTSSSASRPPSHALVKTAFRPTPASSPVLHGPKEVLTCRDGTEERHARIAVVTVGGTPESFAYYSKWKPRTCSIYLQRNRDSSKWTDKGGVTQVSTDRGLFTIERDKGEYRFVFRDVDRERYCGMDGVMNGTLTVRKGSERCEVAGIMEEGVPLGQAVAYMEQQNAQALAESPAPSPTPPPRAAEPVRARHARELSRYDPSSPFPSAAVGMSD